MPFKDQFKNLRFFKRSRALKGRPLWQDTLPAEQEARDTYRIAAKYQSKFSRAFTASVKELLPQRMPLGFKAAYRAKSLVQVEDTLFGLEFGDQAFIEKITPAYNDVLQETEAVTTHEVNQAFNLNIVTKAEAAPHLANVASVAWMETRSLELIKDLNVQQRQVVQDLLTEGFKKGYRAEAVYKQIQENIGLTARESKAVVNRQLLLESQLMPEVMVTKLVDKYRMQLLKARAERIARTETIAANAAGRRHAWEVAQASGGMPAVQREWLSAPPSPNPSRPCKICLELDGTHADIKGAYTSSYKGQVTGPGPEAHAS